ncbi:hypothetical protein OAS39_07790 [Pirellulales bacterium]|nr:hypothetical protein [Pirellulales bacterium]
MEKAPQYDTDTFHRQHRWLGLLYDGATSTIPNEERESLCIGFVAHLDGALRTPPHTDATDWGDATRVKEWAARGLLRGNDVLRRAIWGWVESLIVECGANRTKQVILSAGFFDDLVDSEVDWDSPAWLFIGSRILCHLADDSNSWVTYGAFDEDPEKLWVVLQQYLKHSSSVAYDGPSTREEMEKAYQLWRYNEPQ